MPKKLLVIIPIVLTLALVVFLMPAQQVMIEGIGDLSIESKVVIAASNPPVSETTEQSYTTGEEELIEQIWMRTKNSKVFHSYGIPNRDYHDIYLDAVHYEAGHERDIWTDNFTQETIYWTTWENIDNTLELAGELSPWDWQMVKAGYHVYILNNFTYGQILKFEKANPYGVVLGDVAFQPMALQWTNDLNQIQEVSMPQHGFLSVIDNKIRWEDAYGSGIDFSWSCSSTRLLKLLTISSPSNLPVPEQFIIEGNNPVLELNFIFDPSSELDVYIDNAIWAPSKPTTDTFGTVEFRLDDETVWGFMPLWAWDSSGENELSVAQRIRKAGNKLYVSARVPYDWIQSATFPIYIDAVVDEQVETSLDDACEMVSDGSMSLTDTIIDLGSYAGTTHAGFRFTGIDTTDVENVSIAYLEFYSAQGDSGTVSYTWHGEDTANATTFTTNAYDISNRTRTAASITENPPAAWSNGTWVQTADLSGILNEVFSREDWVSGNALAILNIYNSGSGERRLRSWDYNDHSKAPKLHFENPTDVTYYFDEVTYPNWTENLLMVDGDLGTYAYTSNDGTWCRGSGNTCNGTDEGIITKVELRAYAYGDDNDRIDLRPTFVGGQGDLHETTPGTAPGTWGVYVDITSDTNAPSPWAWSDIVALISGVIFEKVGQGNTMYCAKVEIRVTYHTFDIDIGALPVDRGSLIGAIGTIVDKNNPANASGILHTVRVWANVDLTGFRVGTFYTTNGNILKCRDSETIGSVTAGAERTFEVSITVEAGDYIGTYFDSGDVERDTSGNAGMWAVAGEYIDPNDEAEYYVITDDAMSLYGCGDIGAAANITNSPTSKGFGVVSSSTDYWSKGSAPTFPLDDAECFFEVTNNGDTCSITIKATNFTGGVGWTLGAPAENVVRLKVGKSGDANEDAMVTLTASEQAFISALAGSASKKWEIKMETPTSFTDGAEKTSTITLTATLD